MNPRIASTALADGGLAALATAVGAPLLLTGILTYDYTGSTPIEGGGHFLQEDRGSVLAQVLVDFIAAGE